MKKIIVPLSVILLFSISIYTVVSYNKRNAQSVQNISSSNKTSPLENSDNKSTSINLAISTKTKASDFKLKDLNGKEVSLKDFRGKKVLLNFWATWCPPCKAEMPDIEKFYQETVNSDLVILSVNLGEDNQTVGSFIDKNNYNFNILLDSNQEVAIKYNIISIPTSFFIDKDGNIVSKKVGSMTLEEMRSYANSL